MHTDLSRFGKPPFQEWERKKKPRGKVETPAELGYLPLFQNLSPKNLSRFWKVKMCCLTLSDYCLFFIPKDAVLKASSTPARHFVSAGDDTIHS